MLLEVCIDSVDSACAAEAGGAKRVELCAGLTEGGLTPSMGMVEAVLDAVNIEVMVILRPRGGDFVYSSSEWAVMEKDVQNLCSLGIAGIVFGALLPSGEIDPEAVKRVRNWAGDKDFTFHRAIDMAADPMQAVDTLLELGVPRLLSSGQAATAFEGKNVLAKMVQRVGKDMRIMAGGGVQEDNVVPLIRETGVHEIHATCRNRVPSKMVFKQQAVYMGVPEYDEYGIKVANKDRVKALVALADQV